MKKLIYSTVLALSASFYLSSCGDDNGNNGNGDGDLKKGPNIEFQTNTGTFSGFTFADDSKEVGTEVKIGVKITSEENLKNTKMLVKFMNQPENLVGTDLVFSSNTKTCNREYKYKLLDKGVYVFTAHATDKNATTSTASITVTCYGPLSYVGIGRVYSLQATGATNYSAYDLLNNEAITAASGAGNEAERDIVDNSTSNTLAKSWKSGNGTTFVISGSDGKIGGKTLLQFNSPEEVKDAFENAPNKVSVLNNIEDISLIIVKSTRNGSTFYYLMGINEINDETGADNDYIEFNYYQ